MHRLAPALALVIGLAALYAAIKALRDRAAVRHWPTTTGTVTRRDVIRSQQASGSSPYWSHEVSIDYSYQVGGRDYVGHQLYLTGTRIGSVPQMQKILAAIPDTPSVHYDPDRPEQSCLLITPAWWAVAFGAAAIFCCFFALMLAVSGSPTAP